MECIYGFASSISRDLVRGTVDELRYPCYFDNLVEDLRNEEDGLVDVRKNVQDRVDHAKRQAKRTAELVHNWSEQAKTLINNVEELLKEARAKKSCCFGQCPNWIWQYHLGKQLAKNKGEVKKCIEEGRHYTVLERSDSLPGLRNFSSERYWPFHSRKSAYEQLMKALKGDEINIIGLYGMGGCGKTMLADEVGKKVEDEGLFYKVLLVAVSSAVDVLEIQETIASWLGYNLHEKEKKLRAHRLSKRLTQEDQKFLVILDDVWEMLDFEAIGIPILSSNNRMGCKVLITTRSEEVCNWNGCQEKIKLSILTHEEAWSLFQSQAQISEGTTDHMKHLARQISDECNGLLVAIKAVASTLKGKAEDDWKVAFNRLKSSEPVDIGKGFPDPYKCLRLSYDNLDTKEQSLFLLCSVFPEDFEIPVEILIRFAIGLGLVGDIRSLEGARNEVNAVKNKLIRSCLLSDAAGGKCVKMHDLFRSVAFLIAKNENKMVKCALEKDETLECSSIRYLWCKKFSNKVDCSSIQFLHIETDLEVSDEIFKGMERLRVLSLRWEGLGVGSLSIMSFKLLKNLRCLFLEWWELSDISSVGYMTKLESLALLQCSFFELPDVIITQLTNLRLLHLSECDMKKNPFEVIGRHPQLEELYIDDLRLEWNQYGESTADFFNKFSVPQALKRYQIRLGTRFAKYQEKLLSRGRTLFLSCFDVSNAAVKNLAKKAEVLYMANIHGGAKNIIPDIFPIDGGGGMNCGWIELLICDSEDIEHLVDVHKHLSEVATLLSGVRKLTIEHMEHLGCLYHGRHQSGLFKKLEELYIEDCPQLHGTLFDWKLDFCGLKALELDDCPELTTVFTPAAARTVVHLEILKILYCDGLKHVLADDDSRDDEETSNDYRRLVFPKLKLLTVRGCKKIEYIIPVTFAQGLLQLECLEIEVDHELKYVFGPCKLGANQSQNGLKIELPLLEKLVLVDLPNIITICPRNCYATWPSLNQFALRDCPEFAIVSVNTCAAGSKSGQCDHSTTKIKSDDTNLRAIRVMKDRELSGVFRVAEGSIDGEEDPLTNCLQKLSYICNALVQSMNLQNLEQMEVSGSKEFSSNQIDQIGLPRLKEFMRKNCNQGDQIFIDEDGERQHFMNLHLESKDQLEDFPESTSLPSVPLVKYNSGPFNPCNLKRLILRSCSMLRTLFSPSTATRLTSLEELLIADCHGLRYIVTCESAHEYRDEIIPEDQDSQSYGSIMFPRLKRISVVNCNLLEYILHVSFAQGMVELRCIEIWKAPQLRYVFGENMHDHGYSSHQRQNKIQIELPVLEKIALFSLPNMINICPDTYYATCSSLLEIVMDNVGLFTLSVNNLMVHSESTHSGRSRSSTLDTRAASDASGQLLGSVAIYNSSKIEGIFHLDGFPINERQVTSWLIHLHLVNLLELRYIWKGANHFVTLQNLGLLYICGCQKLKAIFSPCVLRSLPQLKILVIIQCDELEQIIEEDEENEIASSHQSTEVCFSKLKLLLVTRCNKLKRMFHLSTPHEFPELEYLIIYQNPHLEELFEECEQVVRERMVKVSLPELKHVVLMQLPNLNNIPQGTEFKGVTNLLVHDCPKLSLTATTTAEEMLGSHCHDKVIDVYVHVHLIYIRYTINEENADMLEITSQLQMYPQHQPASTSEVLSSQVIGSSQPMPRNLAGSVHDHNQAGNRVTESQEDLTPERRNKGSQALQSLEQKLSPIPSPNLTQGVEDKIKESIEEDSTLEGTIKAAMSAGTDGSGLGVVAQSHTEIGTWLCRRMQNVDNSIQDGSNLMDNEGEIGVVSNRSIEVHPEVCADTRSSHSSTIAELGTFKPSADLDDAKIALLAEAMAVYPHLRNVLDKFSVRFQALMLNTLADMLFFLRNESAASVTPQREKEFLKLCDEAVQLGFERSWVDEMRQRVMVRDPGVDRAHTRLNELLKMRDQLTPELCKIEDEMDNLRDYVDAQKKCFDFQ